MLVSESAGANLVPAPRSDLIIVMADDLTGSADTGIQFGAHGIHARVWLRRPATVLSGVHIVDTNSRGATPSTARARVRSWMPFVKSDARLYKKIDSTLRGNVGIEIEAVLQGSGRRVAIVAPAFPDNRRTTVDGVQLVNGVPVHQTSIANDPAHPMRAPTIAAAISEGTGVPIVLFNLESVRSGATNLRTALLCEISRSTGPRICVVDAALNADLAIIAKTIEMMGSDALPVGSAGLAHYLAGHWVTGNNGVDEPPSVGERILVVAGSQNPTTTEQVRMASSALAIEPLDLLSQSPRTIGARLRERAVIAVSTSAPSSLSATQIAHVIGLRVRAIIKFGRPDALIVTGGDTARGILDLLGAQAIDLLAEVDSGVPLGRIVGGIADGLPIITKAGGFGHPDTFTRAFTYLGGLNRPRRRTDV